MTDGTRAILRAGFFKKQIFWLAVVTIASAWPLSQAAAWEFSMRGEAEWRYRYISRTGPGDLFGNADLAQKSGVGTSIGLAGPQTMTVRLEGYSSKGSDAAYGEQRFWFWPEFRINPALRLRSIVTFQGNVNANYLGGGPNWITNPHYSGWILMDSRDLFSGTGLAVPAVTAFWGTAQTPWGIIAIGTRPGGFGMGWVLHQDDSYARSVALIVPWGPLNFILSQYLHNSFERTDPNDDRNTRRDRLTIASAVDQNEVFKYNTAFALTYKSGAFDFGSLLYVIGSNNRHGWPQGGFLGGLGPQDYPLGATYQDDRAANFGGFMISNSPHMNDVHTPIYLGQSMVYMGITYLSYNNGRFFFNAEYDFLKLETNRNGGRPISGYSQGWATEFGALVGPAKLSFAHFYRSGHDRRGGFFDTNWSTGRFPYAAGTTTYVSDQWNYFMGSFLGGGETPVDPYCFLMGLYGTGNNAYSSTGACTYEDFLAYCTRVDYAVAANLNVFASFLIAQRASNTGTPQGLYSGLWAPMVANPNQAVPQPFGSGQSNVPTTISGLYPHPNDGRPRSVTPNVPDNDLGWECNAGLQWKLLEGMTFKLLFAYWQPGKWFNWAYLDMTFSQPTPPGPPGAPVPGLPAQTYGVVNPSRTISPIMAWQGNLMMEF
jgi:hypothetical protein